MKIVAPHQREVLLDLYRSVAMLFVFYHHTTVAFRNSTDLFPKFNPYAEMFVGISGFMVGMVYLQRDDRSALIGKAFRVFATYFAFVVPVAIVSSFIGINSMSPLTALFEAATFQRDQTSIGILRFYGFAFLCLPLLLLAFKRYKRQTFFISSFTFVAATYFYSVNAVWLENNFFLEQVITVQLQWQFFFVIGIALGDFYKSRALLGFHLHCFVGGIAAVAFITDLTLGFPTNGDKFPYTPEKYINILWSLPLLLYVLYGLHWAARESHWVRYITNVGRNSLFAFALSEIAFECVKLATVLGVKADVLVQQVTGIFVAVLITGVLWLYHLRGTRAILLLRAIAGK